MNRNIHYNQFKFYYTSPLGIVKKWSDSGKQMAISSGDQQARGQVIEGVKLDVPSEYFTYIPSHPAPWAEGTFHMFTSGKYQAIKEGNTVIQASYRGATTSIPVEINDKKRGVYTVLMPEGVRQQPHARYDEGIYNQGQPLETKKDGHDFTSYYGNASSWEDEGLTYRFVPETSYRKDPDLYVSSRNRLYRSSIASADENRIIDMRNSPDKKMVNITPLPSGFALKSVIVTSDRVERDWKFRLTPNASGQIILPSLDQYLQIIMTDGKGQPFAATYHWNGESSIDLRTAALEPFGILRLETPFPHISKFTIVGPLEWTERMVTNPTLYLPEGKYWTQANVPFYPEDSIDAAVITDIVVRNGKEAVVKMGSHFTGALENGRCGILGIMRYLWYGEKQTARGFLDKYGNDLQLVPIIWSKNLPSKAVKAIFLNSESDKAFSATSSFFVAALGGPGKYELFYDSTRSAPVLPPPVKPEPDPELKPEHPPVGPPAGPPVLKPDTTPVPKPDQPEAQPPLPSVPSFSTGGGGTPSPSPSGAASPAADQDSGTTSSPGSAPASSPTADAAGSSVPGEEKPSAIPPAFTDTVGHWAEKVISLLATKGFFAGYPDGTFRPGRAVSRAELVQMISPWILESPKSSAVFRDIKEHHWFYAAVRDAAAQNLISGYPDGSFGPEKSMSRGEVFVVICKLLQLDPLSSKEADAVLLPFTDASSIPQWAKGWIAALVKEGIVAGSDGKIQAQKSVTRGEVAAVLYKILERRGDL